VAIVAALALAIADLPLPSRASPRRRLHLIDRSDSVSRGPTDAPRPVDADRIRAFDQDHREAGDTVLWASFGKEIAFESTTVDPTASNLEGALESALGANPTEIVLYTDGRADPGRSLLQARARGIPVHVFPLGAGRIRDARIARLDVPTPRQPGETVTVSVTVVSTVDVTTTVRLDAETREVTLSAGVPTVVAFPGRSPGPFKASIDLVDDCPENNSASGVVLEAPGERKKVLLLSTTPFPLPGVELEVRPRFADPSGKDVVVLDNVALSADEARRLAAWVTEFRGGLLLLGGRKSFALGSWTGGPLDAVSPLRSRRDQKVAVIFVIDCSGSMRQPGKLDVIRSAVQALWDAFEPGDYVAAYPFPNETGHLIEKRSELNRLEANGDTNIVDSLANARKQLVQVPAARKAIFLLTDGETAPKETPDMRKAEGAALERAGIPLTVITVGKPLEMGRQIPLADWKLLEAELEGLLKATRDTQKENPGVLTLHEHPVTRGLSGGSVSFMNLTSARPDAEVVGTVGTAPELYPAVAFRQAGLGRVGAFAYPHPDPALLGRAIEYVAENQAGGVLLSIDPPVVRARGRDPSPLHPRWSLVGGPSGDLQFRQVLSDTWEAPLPSTAPGTLWVTCGGSRAALTIPCLPEYEALGLDLPALKRIAAETGGRLLRSAGDLAFLPRPSSTETRSGRPVFLVLALVLVFLELGISTFWKP
jgi:hypothetical protein